MINFRSELSKAQYNAVIYTDGPELVIAGAGSGKTRVLTYKIAYLIEQGIDPNQIIALTFTNKAAREMRKRVVSLLDEQAKKLNNIGTFHSIFMRLLRFEAEKGLLKLPFTKDFSVYTPDDTKKVLKEIIEEMVVTTGLDDSKYKPSDVAERISIAKNSMITPTEYGGSDLNVFDKKMDQPAIRIIYEKYNKRLQMANAMDFDDLLLNFYLHLKENDDRRRRYSERIQYVLVDEYQDTNILQKNILLQLTQEKQNICAVGDDAQSIYAFRGAVIDNILHFEEDFPTAKEFKLEQNYRSTSLIVNAANSLIEHNKNQRKKICFSENSGGDAIVSHRSNDARSEAEYVVSVILDKIHDKEFNYGDFAILYRNNMFSSVIEQELIKANIDYVIYGGVGFFERKEVKDLFSYLRLIINLNDDYSLKRIINFPVRGIGDGTITKLCKIASANKISLWNVIENSCNYSTAVKQQKTCTAIQKFARDIKQWRDMLSYDGIDAYNIVEKIVNDTNMISVIKEIDNKEKKEDSSRVGNIYQLLSDVKEFVNERKHDGLTFTLSDYIESRSLFTDEDENKNVQKEKDAVKLMTIHKSKGLEFPVVFVIAFDNDIFPSKKSLDNNKAYEEERRLCYVALTRGKKQVFFTGARERFLFGKSVDLRPSSFLFEIDDKYMNIV